MSRWPERALRKQMVKACRALAQKNLVAATDGNVSARLGYDRVLVTPSNTNKGEVGELDILLCDMDGRKVRGRGDTSSEVHVHLAVYRNREDLHAVVHAHPPTATAFTFARFGSRFFSSRLFQRSWRKSARFPARPTSRRAPARWPKPWGNSFATATSY